MAVSLEATFVLIDNASSKLKEIEKQAKSTDKALRDVGKGLPTQTSGWTKSFTTTGGAIGEMRSEVDKAADSIKDAGSKIDQTSSKVKVFGMEFDKSKSLVKNLTDELKSHSTMLQKVSGAFSPLARGLSTVTNGFKSLRTGVDDATRSFVAHHSSIASVSGGLAGLGAGLKGVIAPFGLMSAALMAGIPLLKGLSGGLGEVASSLASAVGGGAGLGAGLMGSFAVGLGSVVAVAKPAITSLTNYQTAVTNLNKAIASGDPKTIKTAQEQVNQLAKQSPGVAQLANNISGMSDAWKKATSAGRADFFTVANKAISLLRKDMSYLGPEANANVAALKDAFTKNLGPINSALKPLIQNLGQIFRGNIGGFVGGVTNILKGLGNILGILTPQLMQAGDGFQKLTSRFEAWTKSTKGESEISRMGADFRDWVRILGDVAKILGAVLGAGQKQGTSMVGNWANSMDKFTAMVTGPKGQGALQNFFQSASSQMSKLWPTLKDVAKTLLDIYKAWKPLGDVYLKLVDAVAKVTSAIPTPLLTGALAALVTVKAGVGAAGAYSKVKGAIAGFGANKSDGTEEYPWYVIVKNLTGGGPGGTGGGLGGKAAEEAEEAEGAAKGGRLASWAEAGGIRGKIAGGLGKIGIGGAAKEGESLLSKAAGKVGIGGVAKEGESLLSKLKGGATGVLQTLSKRTGIGAAGGAVEGEEGASLLSRLTKGGGWHGIGGATGGLTGMAAMMAAPELAKLIPKGLRESAVGKWAGGTLGGFLSGGMLGAGVQGINALLPASLQRAAGTKAAVNVGMAASTGAALSPLLGVGMAPGALIGGGLEAGSLLRNKVGGIGGRLASIGTEAAAGAGAGALIGSAVPIVGTGVGAAVGGAVGGAVGTFQAYNPFSAKGRKNITDDAKTTWNAIKTGASDTGKWIARQAVHFNPFTAQGQRNIAQAAKNVWGGIKTGASTAANAVAKTAVKFNPFSASGRRNIANGAKAAWDGIKSAFSAAGRWAAGVGNSIAHPFVSAFNWAKNAGKNTFNWVKTAASNVVKSVGTFFTKTPLGQDIMWPFKTAFNWVKRQADNLINFFKGLPGKIGNALKSIGDTLINPFKKAYNWIKDKMPKVSFKSHKVLGVSVPLPSIHLAEGGTVPYTTNVLVGERGPEVVHLPAGSHVTPNHKLASLGLMPTHAAQTGTPTPIAGAAGGAAVGGQANFQRVLATTSAAMTKLVKQSTQINAAFRSVINSLNAVEREFTNPRSGFVGALNQSENELKDFSKQSNTSTNQVSDQFADLAKDARKWLTQIESDTKWLVDEINKIFPPNMQTVRDTVTKYFQQLDQNIKQSWKDIVFNTNWGIGQIFAEMAKAFKQMGVPAPKGVTAAAPKQERGGRLARAERGYRLPGEPKGDHIPLVNRGGQVLALADGGELVVNRHTERRVDQKLARFGTSLGKEVAGETRPHAAARRERGGPIPGLATGGVVGEVNSFFSGHGFNKVAIAGILGNAWQESTGNPNTPGGGMWQQISNFGQGTGGSLQNQMQTMLPQIIGLRASLNSAGSPAQAAVIFEQGFERAGIPALANRERYAQQAYEGKLGAPLTGGAAAGEGGGVAPTIKTPKIKGPGVIGTLGQAAVTKLTAAAQDKLNAAAPVTPVTGGGGGPGPVFKTTPGKIPAKVQAALQAAQALARRHPPYGHEGAGWGLGAYDCSSYVSTVMDAAGIWPKWVYYTAAAPINQHTQPGPGKWITIGTWGTSGQEAHTMMSILGHYFESGGNDGGPHVDSGWSQKFDQYRHPEGFGKGGRTKGAPHPHHGNPGIGHPGYQPTQAEAEQMQHQRRRGKRVQWSPESKAFGGLIPWFANGADFVAKRPQLIGVGDAPGGERVTVTPQAKTTAGPARPVHVEIHNIHVNRKGDVQKIVDEEMQLLAHTIQGRL